MFYSINYSKLYKKPTILTANLSFAKWGNLFSNSAVATAILDRIVHHCKIVKIRRRISYKKYL